MAATSLMKVKTAFTEMTGVEKPLMCGGMHYVGYAELVAAVANAGCFGCITALTQPNPEALRQEIRKCRTLTSKPFGVNITLLPVGVPPDYPGLAKVCIEEGIKVIETAGREPSQVINLVKPAGIKIIHKTTSVRHAISAIKRGVDMISIDGFECGGHPGNDDVTTWVVLPKACAKLNVPIIVSGACANGRQLAAALVMGATGLLASPAPVLAQARGENDDAENNLFFLYLWPAIAITAFFRAAADYLGWGRQEAPSAFGIAVEAPDE